VVSVLDFFAMFVSNHLSIRIFHCHLCCPRQSLGGYKN
jgi:hypothetical protein